MDLELLFATPPNGLYSGSPSASGQEYPSWDHEGKNAVVQPSWLLPAATPPESPVDPLSNIWADLQNPVINNNASGDFSAIELNNWFETPIDFQYLFNNIPAETQEVFPPQLDTENEASSQLEDALPVEENWLQSFTDSPVSVEELESILSSEPGSPAQLMDTADPITTINLLDFVDPPVEFIQNQNNVESLFSSENNLSVIINPADEDSDFVDVELLSFTNTIDQSDISYESFATPPARQSRRKRPVESTVTLQSDEPVVKSGRITKKNRTMEKKLRKMQQNKDAATRYRIKKKDEKNGTGDELTQLETRNSELKQKVESLSNEIKYLKDLMAEVYKAKSKTKKRVK